MYKQRKVLCFILARGGSKGLPNKNILNIAGKPLIAHSIDIAKEVNYIDEIYVSTEDKQIKEISTKYGAKVIDRPSELASDTAITIDAIKHMIENIPRALQENPIVVWFHVTTPIRKVSDVEKCVEMYDENVDCVVSVGKVKVHPSWALTEKKGFLHYYLNLPVIINRQESPLLYFMNGSVIISDCKFLHGQERDPIGGGMKAFFMDDKHSLEIDTKFDFDLCKLIMENSFKEF